MINLIFTLLFLSSTTSLASDTCIDALAPREAFESALASFAQLYDTLVINSEGAPLADLAIWENKAQAFADEMQISIHEFNQIVRSHLKPSDFQTTSEAANKAAVSAAQQLAFQQQNLCNRSPGIVSAIKEATNMVDCEDITPEMLSLVKYIHVWNDAEGFKSSDLKGLKNLDNLYIFGRHTERPTVKMLPAGFFEDQATLTGLEIEIDADMKLDENTFGALRGLKRLKVTPSNPCFSVIPSLIFKNLPHLEELALHMVTIPDGDSDYLKNLVSLKSLIIFNYNFSMIPEGFLDQQPELESVSISLGQLQSLPQKLFDKNPKLKQLDLKFNGFTISVENEIIQRLAARGVTVTFK